MTSGLRDIPKQLLCGLLVATTLFADVVIAGTNAPTEDGLWYYEIGGAEPVSVPANPKVTSVTLGGSVQQPLEGIRLPWDTDRLMYSVREPFPSQVTQCSMVHGAFNNELPLKITSRMARNGIIFSDGVEADYLEFNSGEELTITTASQKAHLIVKPIVRSHQPR